MRPRPKLLSNAIMWPYFLLMSLVNMVLGVLATAFTWPFDRHRRTTLWMNRWFWGKLLFPIGPLWTLRRAPLPELGPGPYLIVSNHTSLLDIPCNLGLPLPIRICARKTLFRVPIMGWYMRFSRHICIDSDGADAIRATAESIRTSLQDGISVLIFAEGTRSEDGEIAAFNKAPFRLARELDVPLLPVVVDGTGQALPKNANGLVQNYCRFQIRVLPPVDPKTAGSSKVLSKRVREQMIAALAELRGPALSEAA